MSIHRPSRGARPGPRPKTASRRRTWAWACGFHSQTRQLSWCAAHRNREGEWLFYLRFSSLDTPMLARQPLGPDARRTILVAAAASAFILLGWIIADPLWSG